MAILCMLDAEATILKFIAAHIIVARRRLEAQRRGRARMSFAINYGSRNRCPDVETLAGIEAAGERMLSPVMAYRASR